jgi:hypothetical protein
MFHETWRMENMFKKTLLALAIAGAAFNASATLTVAAGGSGTGGVQLISMEGASNSTSVTPSNVVATLSAVGADYASSAKIRVTITGGTLTPATDATFSYYDDSTTTTTNLVTTGTVTYPSSNVVEIALTAAGAAETAVRAAANDDTLTLGGLDITATSFSKGATISYLIEVVSSVGGAVIDSKSGTVTTVAEQFSTSIATGDDFGTSKVDVGDDRLNFVDNNVSESVTVDVDSIKVDHLAADANTYAPTYVLNGSFGFLGTVAADIVTAGDVTSTTTSPVINAGLTTITEVAAAFGAGEFDGAAADTTFEVITLTADGKTQVLTPQAFTVDVSFNYDDDETKKGTFAKTISGGAWKLNGDSAYIPFMPFDSAFAQSITVTNSGSVDGAITVDITANGETNTHMLTAVATGETITNITGEIIAAAKADGVTGNAAITVVTNSPSTDISVSALYYSKADADRGIVSVTNQ